MFGLPALSSAVPGAQLDLYQSKLQQARSEAAQAQNEVIALEAQTDRARQRAAQAQDTARSMEGQTPRTQPTLSSRGGTSGGYLDVLV